MGPPRTFGWRAQLVRFAAVGILGFVVDAGGVHLLIRAGADLFSAQAVAFLCALTATWALNRRFTFHPVKQGLLREWLRYAAANSTGGIANNAVYALLVWRSAFFARYPTLAVMAGSLAGLAFNFTATRALVYGHRGSADTR